jgi:hypothetical protein
VTLQENINQANETVKAAQRRANALDALRSHDLTFDPPGVDYASFWVANATSNGQPLAVHAVRVDDNRWLWLDPDTGGFREDRWTVLIDSITDSPFYPLGYRLVTGDSVTSLVTGARIEPRQQ